MVPRALQRPKPSTAAKSQTQTAKPTAEKSPADEGGAGAGDQKPAQKLSNADFAKMLMKKWVFQALKDSQKLLPSFSQEQE